MADVDINPLGNHDKTDARSDKTGETIPPIPFTPTGVIGESTWEPEREQETSFGIGSQRIILMREDDERLYFKNLKDTSALKEDISTCSKSEIENYIIKVWKNP